MKYTFVILMILKNSPCSRIRLTKIMEDRARVEETKANWEITCKTLLEDNIR